MPIEISTFNFVSITNYLYAKIMVNDFYRLFFFLVDSQNKKE